MRNDPALAHRAQIIPIATHRRSVLRQLRRFTQDLFTKYDAVQIILAPLGALSLLLTFFSFAFRSTSTAIELVVAVLVATWLAGFFLASVLHHNRSALTQANQVVRRLTELCLEQQTATAYTWEQWDEHMVISRDGDTTTQQWRVLRAVGQDVRVAWSAQAQTPRGDLTDRDRRAVTVTAHSYHYDADGRRVIGVPYEVTPVWRDDADALAVYLCFDHKVEVGDTRMIVFTWTWPGFHRRLLAGEPDEIAFTRKQGRVGFIKQTVTFDRSCSITSDVALRPLGTSVRPSQSRDPDGSVTIVAQYDPTPPEVVGFVAHVARTGLF
jgi:hypothetical protein